MNTKKIKRNKQMAVRLNEVELVKLVRFAEENGISPTEALRLLVQKLP